MSQYKIVLRQEGKAAGQRVGRALGAQAGAGTLGWACVGHWAGVRGALGRGAAAARRARGTRRQRATGAWAGTAWARRGARLGARSALGTAGLGVA